MMLLNATEEIGKYFGYPTCCISAFEDIIQNAGKKTPEQSFVGSKGYGFIPCPEHAKQVAEGKITLQSLIKDRVCPLPFPSEPGIEVIDEYLMELA